MKALGTEALHATRRRSRWSRRAVVPGPPEVRRRPTSPGPCATSCWSATPGRARPRWSRPCSPRPGTITRAGRVEDGTTVTDFDEAEHRQQRSDLARAGAARARRRQGQPARHPRLRRLRRRPARRPAGRRRRAVRRLGRRRRRRRDPDALGGVRRGRHAARRRRHQAGQGPRRLRRGGRDLPAGLRRRRAAAVPADGRRRRHRGRPDRPAVADGRRLLRRHPGRARARPRAPAADRRPPATR